MSNTAKSTMNNSFFMGLVAYCFMESFIIIQIFIILKEYGKIIKTNSFRPFYLS